MTRHRSDEPLMPLQVEHWGGPADGRLYPATLVDYPGVQIEFPLEREVPWECAWHRYVLEQVDGRWVYRYRGLSAAAKGGNRERRS